jgi:hypothetical protein
LAATLGNYPKVKIRDTPAECDIGECVLDANVSEKEGFVMGCDTAKYLPPASLPNHSGSWDFGRDTRRLFVRRPWRIDSDEVCTIWIRES